MAPLTRTRRERAALVALPVYWVALFIATHLPGARIPGEIPQSDKVVHVTVFGLLAFLFWQFWQALRPIGARFAWASAIGLTAYAAFDEYLQQFVGRYTDIADFVANASGIVSVVVALELVRRHRAVRSARCRP